MKTAEREPIVSVTDNSDIGMEDTTTVYYPIECKDLPEFQDLIKTFELIKEYNEIMIVGSNILHVQILSGETEKGWKYLAFYK